MHFRVLPRNWASSQRSSTAESIGHQRFGDRALSSACRSAYVPLRSGVLERCVALRSDRLRTRSGHVVLELAGKVAAQLVRDLRPLRA